MLLLRDVARGDLAGLKRLAATLNSVNLPNEEKVLAALIGKSIQSFAGKIEDPFKREYLFVLEDLRNETIIGTSMIIALEGVLDLPGEALNRFADQRREDLLFVGQVDAVERRRQTLEPCEVPPCNVPEQQHSDSLT